MFYAVALVMIMVGVAGCGGEQRSGAYSWGKSTAYDNFLWSKYVPDTLCHAIGFEFNNDARQHMDKPLRLALFERDENGGVGHKVESTEAELFVDGIRAENNEISVMPTTTEVMLGIVFSPKAAAGVRYWYLRPVDDGGLDLINDRVVADYDDDAIMEISAKLSHKMNPLAQELLVALIVLVVLLVVWLLMLKPLLYPSFRVKRLSLIGPEPYSAMLQIKGCRRLVLTAKPCRQGWLNRLLTGEVKYCVNQMWTADVVFEPKDKRSIRIKPDRQTYMTDGMIMSIHEEYVLENLNTKTKTIMSIS